MVLRHHQEFSITTAAPQVYAVNVSFGPNVNHMCFLVKCSMHPNHGYLDTYVGYKKPVFSHHEEPTYVHRFNRGIYEEYNHTTVCLSGAVTGSYFLSVVPRPTTGEMTFTVKTDIVVPVIPWTAIIFAIAFISILALLVATASICLACRYQKAARYDIARLYVSQLRPVHGNEAHTPLAPPPAYDAPSVGTETDTVKDALLSKEDRSLESEDPMPSAPPPPSAAAPVPVDLYVPSDKMPPVVAPINTDQMSHTRPPVRTRSPQKSKCCSCDCCSGTTSDYPGYRYRAYDHPVIYCPDCFWPTVMCMDCCTGGRVYHHHTDCCICCASPSNPCCDTDACDPSACNCDCGGCTGCGGGSSCNCNCSGGNSEGLVIVGVVLLVIAFVILVLLTNVLIAAGAVFFYRFVVRRDWEANPFVVIYRRFVLSLGLSIPVTLAFTLLATWTYGISIGLMIASTSIPCFLLGVVALFSSNPSLYRAFATLYSLTFWIAPFIVMNYAYVHIALTVIHTVFKLGADPGTYLYLGKNTGLLFLAACCLFSGIPSVAAARAMRVKLRAQAGLPDHFDDERGLALMPCLIFAVCAGASWGWAIFWIRYPEHPVTHLAAVLIAVGAGLAAFIFSLFLLRPRKSQDAPRPHEIAPIPGPEACTSIVAGQSPV